MSNTNDKTPTQHPLNDLLHASASHPAADLQPVNSPALKKPKKKAQPAKARTLDEADVAGDDTVLAEASSAEGESAAASGESAAVSEEGGAAAEGGLLGFGSGFPALGMAAVGGIAVAAATQSGGGGSGTAHSVSTTETLLVQDGAIKGAQVVTDGNNDGVINFTDTDGDGQFDEGETLLNGDTLVGKTGDDGRLTNVKSSDIAGKVLLMAGGIDISTGLAVSVGYKAAAGSSVINPLTTLVQHLVEGGLSATAAENQVKAALGIPGSVDLSSYDLTAASAGLDIQKAAIQVANLLTVAEGMQAGLAEQTLDALTAALQNGSLDSIDDLADSAVIAGLLTTAQGETPDADTARIAAALAAANRVIADSADLAAAIEAQIVAQGDLVTAIAENADLDDFDSIDDIHLQISDKTAPTLTLVALDDDVLSGSEAALYQQQYSAADDNLKTVSAEVRNSAGQAVAVELNVADGVISGDLSSLPDGRYSIVVTAVDKAGNSTTQTQSLFLGDGPSLTISDIPAIGAAADDGALLIKGDSANISSGETLTLTLGGNTYTALVGEDGTWSAAIPATDVQALAQGFQAVTASWGEVTESETFIYDTASPTLVLGNHAINSDTYASGDSKFAYAFKATDSGSGVADVTATLKTTAGALVSGVSLTVADGVVKGDLGALTRGTYVIELTATDSAGNSTTQSRQVSYDTTSSGSALVLTPLADSTFNATDASSYSQPFSWKMVSAVTTTAKVLTLDGAEVSGVNLNVVDNRITGNLSALSDGIYRIQVEVTYTGGKTPETHYREQLIAIDKSAPELTLHAPADTLLSGREIAGFELGFTTTDSSGLGIATVTAAVKNADGQTVKTATAESGLPGEFSGLLSDLASGTYTIEITATDVAGNRTTQTTDAITIEAVSADTTPPTLVITDNVSAETARGDLTYTFTFDENVSGFTADDVTVTHGSKGTFTQVDAKTYTLVVSPTADTIGDLTVSVAAGVAHDAGNNGNLASATVTQHFDTATETVAPTLVLGTKPIGADTKSAGAFAFAYAAQDDAGIDRVTAVLMKDGVNTGLSLSVVDGRVTGNLSSLATGTYVIELTATDSNGNSTTRSQEFTYNTSTSGTAIALEQLTDNVFNLTEAAAFSQHVSWTSNSNNTITAVVKDAAGNTVEGIALTYDATSKLISGDLSALADGIYRVEITVDYRGTDIVTREQIIVIDQNAPGSSGGTVTSPVFTSSVASDAGLSANASAYFGEFADYDQDGDLDLLVGSNSASAASKLYSNDGDGTFTDVTSSALGTVQMSLGGVAWVDYDKDGDLDIVMAGGSSSTATRLLQNNNGVFTDVATAAGIANTASAIKSVTAIDYDGDGQVDLHFTVQAGADKLYKNNGDGTFTEVAAAAGIAGNATAQDQQALWGDFDRDGDLDLFVATNNANSAFANSRLYFNNGDGTFADVTTEKLGDVSMTLLDAVAGDYDGDGDLDLFLAGNVAGNRLLQNDGTGTFTDVATAAGVLGNSAGRAYASEFVDLNGDNRLDLVVTGVNRTDVYLNNGDGTFTDVSASTGIAATVQGRDIVAGDIDQDGDLDLINISSSSPLLSLHENLAVDTDRPTVTLTDNVAQTEVILLQLGTVANSTTYRLTLNGTSVSYTSDASATAAEIHAGLKAAVEANATTSALVTVGAALDGDQFALISKSATPLSVSGTGVAVDATVSNAQISTLDIGTALPQTTYSVTLNGITVSYTADTTPTVSEIHLGLKAAIEGNATLNSLVNVAPSLTSTDQIALTAKTADGFTVSASGGQMTAALSSTGIATGDITCTLTFLEPVLGLTVDDISVVNGSKGTLTQVSDRVYSLVVTPTDEAAGQVQVSIPANAFTDLAGNSNDASAVMVQTFNTLNPAVTITDDATGTATGPVTYTFTFNEAVTGFTADDVNVTNGTKGELVQISDQVYRLVVTPDAGEVGYLTVDVAGGVLTDLNGNSNLAASNAAQLFDTDTTAPTVTLTDNVPSGNATGNILFTFTFDEYVTGFATGDISVTNGSKGSFTTVETGRVYTLLVSPIATGDVTVSIAENLLTDLGGNGNLSVSASQSYQDVGLINTANLGDGGYILSGSTASAGRFGYSVSNAGDVNGDGLADVVIGAYRETVGTTSNSGVVYVAFGKTGTETIDVANLGSNGYKIYNSATSSRLGTSVSQAGDLNGDGLGDLLIGGNNTNGRAYVVYGKTDSADIDLANLTASQGFSMTGPSDVLIGKWVDAGDIDGDGLSDLMVSNSSNSAVSSTYVVFGKSIQAGTTASLDLTQIADNGQGLILKGISSETFGNSIAFVGDVNGDGKGDMLIAAPTAKDATKTTQSNGAAYLIYGTDTAQTLDLATLTTEQGYRITGPIPTETAVTNVQFAQFVGSAGDVNGDGLADMIIGSSSSAAYGYKAYVVFGQAGSGTTGVDVTQPGDNGFVIQNGSTNVIGVGSSVAYAGDLNGDGLADVIVGAASGNQAFVVYGKTDSTAVNLDNIANGVGGFAINGGISAASTGISVSAAGDVNGDGFDDLIVGASAAALPTGEDTTASNAGQSYVIFGGSSQMTTLDQAGTAGNDVLSGTAASQTAVLGAGNDTYTANGGADVIYAGAGNDAIILNASNVSLLEAGVTDGQLAKIDGGSGIDTLLLDGSGITLDLNLIANPGAGDSRLESIEKIDLTGSGNNRLKLSLADVLDLSGTNLFNSGNGWTGLDASEDRHQLVVTGNSGDQVDIDLSGWTSAGSATYDSAGYAIYNQGNAQLLIEQQVAVI